MSDVVAELLALDAAKSTLRLDDAMAVGPNTVLVGGSTVAVALPAIIPVTTGQFCQVLTQGENRVIVGPASSTGNLPVGGNSAVSGNLAVGGTLTVGGLQPARMVGWDDGSMSDTTGITGLSNVGMQVDFVADPTRVYRTTVVVSIAQIGAAGFPVVNIANGSNTSLRSATSNMGANARAQIALVHVESGISGSQRRQVQCSTSAGSMTVYGGGSRGTIVVEDMGAA